MIIGDEYRVIDIETILAIDQFVADHGYCPTVRDLRKPLQVSSPSTIHSRLTRLRKLGFVDWVEDSNRTLHVLDAGRQHAMDFAATDFEE